MISLKILPESYQRSVYRYTLATLKRLIQQAENPKPAVVISTEAAHVENAILLDYLTSEVALEQPEIRSTDTNIRTDSNYMYDELHFGTPVGSRDYKDADEECEEPDVSITASRPI